MAVCNVCFRKCRLDEGQIGFCGGRVCSGDRVRDLNYGRVTALALDPIEKKPLARFYPGSMILSVGSFGCNLRCPFCQNHEISWSEEALQLAGQDDRLSYLTPEQLTETAAYYRNQGNIGVAFTYNEPLIGYEFVRDTARLVHEEGMKNVLVTNGTANLWVLEELAPYIDAMNIDIKSMSDKTYREVLGGDLETVKTFIRRASESCHVELTMLIVPGMNDSEEEMTELVNWISGLKGGADIPLHISRFFPRYKMTDKSPTDVNWIYHLADIARTKLKYVYTGNC